MRVAKSLQLGMGRGQLLGHPEEHLLENKWTLCRGDVLTGELIPCRTKKQVQCGRSVRRVDDGLLDRYATLSERGGKTLFGGRVN